LDQVNAAVAKLLKDPAILERLAKQGIEPQAMTSAEFNRLLRVDVERMAKVVEASGARIDQHAARAHPSCCAQLRRVGAPGSCGKC
jgi:predicted HicB family RNase H-like nuclease